MTCSCSLSPFNSQVKQSLLNKNVNTSELIPEVKDRITEFTTKFLNYLHEAHHNTGISVFQDKSILYQPEKYRGVCDKIADRVCHYLCRGVFDDPEKFFMLINSIDRATESIREKLILQIEEIKQQIEKSEILQAKVELEINEIKNNIRSIDESLQLSKNKIKRLQIQDQKSTSESNTQIRNLEVSIKLANVFLPQSERIDTSSVYVDSDPADELSEADKQADQAKTNLGEILSKKEVDLEKIKDQIINLQLELENIQKTLSESRVHHG